jgi:GDPmannose 4,6-dehydratase
VEIDEKLIRPAEVDCLRGDSTKAREKLGWEPKIGFQELIEMMVDADLRDFEPPSGREGGCCRVGAMNLVPTSEK